MANKVREKNIRPCEVVVKILGSKSDAPLDEDERALVTSYLSSANDEKLGELGKKGIAHLSNADFGKLIRGRMKGLLKNRPAK
jgi:hypothetical protein